MLRIIKVISITVVLLFVSIWGILFLSPAPPLLTGLNYSKAVYDSHNQLLRLTLTTDGKYRLQTPLTDIAPIVADATLLQEDQYFHWHPGLNPISLLKAAWRTYVKGPRRIGASTITMQVVHIRYGINSKTISGKLWQIARALQLEAHYSKNEILDAYLNLAPYGNNIEGIGAASLIYFGKPANSLTLPEALTLAVIPQNPSKRAIDREKLKIIRNHLYKRWVIKHPLDNNKSALMQLPLQMHSVREAPFLAPHFVNDVLTNKQADNNQIKTTLDYRMQQMIERIMRNYISRKSILGVNNAAILIVDSRDMSIKTMIGSTDFYNKKIGGQINGTNIKRSPGSTLKPFIYALAIDQGIIHPGTMLKDVPHSFGSYNPENVDNDFIGPVKAKDALVLSRNIPAIYLADQLKNPTLYTFLQEANIPNLKSETHYGLALVLGGAELSMKELVGLYALLANGGTWRPLRDLKTAEKLTAKPLLSKEASFLVLDMLSSTSSHTKTAMKTGTSSGYRDAWTIGLVGPYVMAVWIGNFNNQGNPAFVGKEMAAPLFNELASAMQAKYGPFATLYPNPGRMNLIKIDVCKASGMLPTRYCPDTETEWFIPGKSPIITDTIYREIAINEKTGLRTCHFDQHTHFEVVEFWPSDILNIFKRAGIQRRTPPPYDADCTLGSKVGVGFSPQITSPQAQVSYVAKLAQKNKSLIYLSAVVDADVKNLYWFANETFLGKTSRSKPFLWWANPGKYVIRIVDDYGRSDARDLQVQTVA